MSIAAEFTNQIALVNTRKRELETPALSTCATIASSINQLTSEVSARHAAFLRAGAAGLLARRLVAHTR